jgi:chromosome segregation ATPase
MNERQRRQHVEAVVLDKDAEIANMNSLLEESASQKQQLKTFIESLQSESRQKEDALKELLVQSRSEANSVKLELEESKTRHQESLKQLCANIEEAERSKSDHAASVSRFENEIRLLSDKTVRLEQEFLKACEALNAARNEKTEVSSQLAQYSAYFEDKKREFEEVLISKDSEINASVNEKNRALEEVHLKDEELQRLRAQFEDTVAELQAEIQSRDKHVAYMSKSLNDMTAQLNGLQKIAESNPYQSRPSTLLDAFTASSSNTRRQSKPIEPVATTDDDNAAQESRQSMAPPPPKTPASKSKPTASKPTSNSSTKVSDSINLTAYTKVLSKQQEAKAAPKTRGRPKAATKKALNMSQSDDDVFSFK